MQNGEVTGERTPLRKARRVGSNGVGGVCICFELNYILLYF